MKLNLARFRATLSALAGSFDGRWMVCFLNTANVRWLQAARYDQDPFLPTRLASMVRVPPF